MTGSSFAGSGRSSSRERRGVRLSSHSRLRTYLQLCVDGLVRNERPQIFGIVFRSTIKGLLAGLLIGLFARKVRSMPATLVFGVLVAGLFAFLVACMQGEHNLEIIVPGSIVGLLTGYATQRYGRSPAPSAG
jgi:hypothetical protein